MVVKTTQYIFGTDLLKISDAPDSGMPSFGRSEDGMADDRIAHILSEASSMIKPSPQQQHHLAQQQQHLQQQHHMLKQHDDSMNSNDDSKSPPNQCTSPFSRDSQNRRLKKYDNDDIPHDKVTRIYQEELAKLMSRGSRDSFPRYVTKLLNTSINQPIVLLCKSGC